MSNMKQKDVYLIPARNGGSGKVEWTWAYGGDFGKVQTFPVIDLAAGSGAHKISFTIIDPLGQINFDNSNVTGPGGPYENAIWIMPKTTGPKQPGVAQNDQIKNITIGKNGTQLTLDDGNSGNPSEFTYQLNFKSSAGGPVTAIDPDLKNGGGGGGGELSFSALETAAIALVAAVATALLFGFRKGRGSGGGAMPPNSKGNPIKVTVTADLDPTTKKVRFDHEWEYEGTGGPVKKGHLDVPPGDYMVPIAFHLKDQTGLRLKFYGDPADAMYCGSTCPPLKGDGGQISFDSSSPHLLKVSDANTGPPVDLKYALRFEGDANPAGGEAAPYVYDPDLKNGGGGVPIAQ